MAEAKQSDLIMKFKPKGKDYVWGECMTYLNTEESDMTKGFICATNVLGKVIQEKSNLIELDSFSFRTSVDGTDDEAKEGNKNYDAARRSTDKTYESLVKIWQQGGSKGQKPDHPGYPGSKPESGAAFAKWREGKGAVYQPEIAPVEITRGIDKASTILMQLCIDRTTLESATLIKRKASGSLMSDGTAVSGEIYLRFDFDTVLLTKVDWDEDDPVKEKISFISRAVTVSYRPQLPDGSLGAVVPGFYYTGAGYKIFDLKGYNN